MRYMFLILFIIGQSGAASFRWSRDTVVEQEYQPSYCLSDPSKASICSNETEFTNISGTPITIDSINFKVVTQGIASSHTLVYLNQSEYLPFAYSSSGKQAGYPWKFSKYNDPQTTKITLKPGESQKFLNIEIDNCLFSCPTSSNNSSGSKTPVTGLLILVYGGQRDTLTILGLQSPDTPSTLRNQKKINLKGNEHGKFLLRNSIGQIETIEDKRKTFKGIFFEFPIN